jgi:hypothetical protein
MYCGVTVPLLFRGWVYPSSKGMLLSILNYDHIFDVQKTYYTFMCFRRIYEGSLNGVCMSDWKANLLQRIIEILLCTNHKEW